MRINLDSYDLLCFKVVRETKKAYLFEDENGEFWCPKKLFKKPTRTKKKLCGLLWVAFNIDYLKKAEDDFETLDKSIAERNAEIAF